MYVEEYYPHIGISTPRHEQYISAESIRHFAEAVGEDNPLYYDEEYARGTKYGRIIAPPTYSFTLDYPTLDGIWLPPVGRLHAKQKFKYNRPIYAGETVYCSQMLKSAYEKQGKSGLMVFLVQEKCVYSSDGDLICSQEITTINREILFKERHTGNLNLAKTPERCVQVAPHTFYEDQQLPEITLGPITRSDIIKYAGAAWDYNAIHIDDAAAIKAGLPGVIAHGMLSAALQAKVAGIWTNGLYAFKDYEMRFNSSVMPGDTLSFTGMVNAVNAETGEISIAFSVTNPAGTSVVSGSIRMEPI
ncbi:MAG: MaoC family dehydratase N-terminal domain-containing protein [Candidatus Limivicinus sp.]